MKASAIPKIGCVQHDCAECQRRESARRATEATRGESATEDLRRNYPTHDEALEELDYRIEEVLELRQQLAAAKNKRAPKALAERIRELEKDLATVNARLADAQSLTPSELHLVRDLAEHGLRFDLNPTLDHHPDRVAFSYLAYIKRIDDTIRERARRALSELPKSP